MARQPDHNLGSSDNIVVPPFLPGTISYIQENWLLNGEDLSDPDHWALFMALERVLPLSMAVVYVSFNGELRFGITRPWSHPKLQTAEIGDNLIHVYAGSEIEEEREYADLLRDLLIQAHEGVVATRSVMHRGSSRIIQVTPCGPDRALILIRNLNEENTIDTEITKQLAMLQAIVENVRRLNHDARSPMAAIFTFKNLVKRLLDNPHDQRVREAVARQLEGVTDSINLLDHLLRQVVQSTRPLGERLEPKIERFKLEPLLTNVIDAEVGQHMGRHVNLVVAKEAQEIVSVRILVWEMMANLLSNAIKYSPADTTVTIEVIRRGDCIYLSVVDHGIGMTNHDKARLFIESFRSEEAIKTANGTGKGSTVVRDLLGELGGVPMIKSDPGEGTTITIVLPVELVPPGPPQEVEQLLEEG